MRLCSRSFALLGLSASVRAQGVLVFTKATDYYHASIPTAEMAIQQMGQELGFPVLVNNDSSVFNQATLNTLSVVAFVSNSEPLDGPSILTDDEQSALVQWLSKGGGFVGVHAATACLFNISWYETLIGAIFDYHPDLQQASFLVTNRSNPSTSNLPSPWTYVEEVYNFYSDPRINNVTLMLTVNESSYYDPNNASYQAQYNEGTPHPIGWYREASTPGIDLGNGTFAPGRAWYTSLGHTIETWQNETFLSHIQNGIGWVLEASPRNNFTNATRVTSSASTSPSVARALASATSAVASVSQVKSSASSLAVPICALAVSFSLLYLQYMYPIP